MFWNLFRSRITMPQVPSRRCRLRVEELEDRVVPTFHLWKIDQVFSSADGKVQFIELHDSFSGENLLQGHSITSTANSFTFPANLPSNQTANHHFLIATTDYASQPGAVTPDYTVPDNFFAVSGDTLNYAGVSIFTFTAGQLPTDGIHSLSIDSNGNVTTIANSETNFASQTGSVSVTPPGFVYDPNTQTLTITGKSFMYSQTTTSDMTGTHTTYTFTMDGTTHSYPDTQLSHVIVNGQGSATATLVTSDTYTGTDGKPHETAEIVVLGAGGGQVQKIGPTGAASVFVQLNNFPTSYAYVGRADSGRINAKPGGQNIFVTGGGYSYIFGMGEFHLISGAPNVYGYSANSTDQAWHYDTAALDSFVSSGRAYSYMSGTDAGKTFFNVAVGFGVNYGIATHGMSFAYLIDSPGNDTFFGSTAYSYISGTTGGQSLFNVAEGFALVFGQSFQGGMDFAYNRDPSHNVLGGNWILLM
jgi:hypothetical protein